MLISIMEKLSQSLCDSTNDNEICGRKDRPILVLGIPKLPYWHICLKPGNAVW